MPLHLLYPSDPLEPRRADDHFLEEAGYARARGFAVHLFSSEDFQAGLFRPRPALEAGVLVLYRGWMLTLERYTALSDAVARAGAALHTSPEEYTATHYLPHWYGLLEEFTPRTRFYPDARAAQAALSPHWSGPLFVKDWVKSLSTGHGPIARTPEDLPIIEAQMRQYRGTLEGGLCVRDFEDLKPGSERRFFVVANRPFPLEGPGLEPVRVAADRISSDFFCVDVAQRQDGVWRIVELGDGQVSDRKEWAVEAFVGLLASHFLGSEGLGGAP